jgi:hypothetical protein
MPTLHHFRHRWDFDIPWRARDYPARGERVPFEVGEIHILIRVRVPTRRTEAADGPSDPNCRASCCAPRPPITAPTAGSAPVIVLAAARVGSTLLQKTCRRSRHNWMHPSSCVTCFQATRLPLSWMHPSRPNRMGIRLSRAGIYRSSYGETS